MESLKAGLYHGVADPEFRRDHAEDYALPNMSTLLLQIPRHPLARGLLGGGLIASGIMDLCTPAIVNANPPIYGPTRCNIDGWSDTYYNTALAKIFSGLTVVGVNIGYDGYLYVGNRHKEGYTNL